MSLTGPDNVFAGLHEDGANDLLRAFFHARPHYLNYGSPPFVTTSTVQHTQMPPIPFPGIPGGIGWSVAFGIPRVDFYKDSSGGALPSQLTLGPGQLSLATVVRLCVQCGAWKRGPHDKPGSLDDRQRDDREPRDQPGWHFEPVCTRLELWAIAEPVTRYFAPGVGDIAFHVDAIELVDITPDSLESVLECMIRMMLAAALDQVRLPFHALSAGAFSLALTRGPEIDDDTLKLWGTL